MIYTSYYNRIKYFSKHPEYYLIQISNSVPEFAKPLIRNKFKFLTPGELVPQIKLEMINQEQYRELYIKQLVEVDAVTKLGSIEELLSSQGFIPVLFCWESPNKFCHRHILSDYYNKISGGLKMSEYNFDK